MSVIAWNESTWNNDNGWGGILVASVSVTGVAATSSVGNGNIQQSIDVNLTGVTATVSTDDVALDTEGRHGVTSVSALGVAGDLTVQAKGSTTLTAVPATATLGTATASIPKSVTVTGLGATSALGEDAVLLPTTWGYNTWNGSDQGWGGFLFVEVSLTGLQGTTGLGTATQTGDASLTLVGTPLTASLSTGVEVEAGADHPVNGVSASVSVGSVVAAAGAKGSPAGLQATASAGSLGFRTTNFITLTGVSASNVLGTTTVRIDSSVTITGLSATVSTITPLVWGDIDDNQTPNWLPIAA